MAVFLVIPDFLYSWSGHTRLSILTGTGFACEIGFYDTHCGSALARTEGFFSGTRGLRCDLQPCDYAAASELGRGGDLRAMNVVINFSSDEVTQGKDSAAR